MDYSNSSWLSMISWLRLHPGLTAQRNKLCSLGLVLLVLTLISVGDLVAAILASKTQIVQWRPAIEPALLMVIVIAPVLTYSLVWKRLRSLRRASTVVQSSPSRPMLLTVWKKDMEKKKQLFFFELQPEDQFGCVTASFVIVADVNSSAALPLLCEQSWHSKQAVAGFVKAFVDDYTGLPVALQTTDALEWVGLNIYAVNADDKEKMLQKANSVYQLSTDGK